MTRITTEYLALAIVEDKARRETHKPFRHITNEVDESGDFEEPWSEQGADDDTGFGRSAPQSRQDGAWNVHTSEEDQDMEGHQEEDDHQEDSLPEEYFRPTFAESEEQEAPCRGGRGKPHRRPTAGHEVNYVMHKMMQQLRSQVEANEQRTATIERNMLDMTQSITQIGQIQGQMQGQMQQMQSGIENLVKQLAAISEQLNESSKSAKRTMEQTAGSAQRDEVRPAS